MPVWRNGRVPLANRLLDYLLPISFDLAEIALCPVDGSDVACVDAGRAKEAASRAGFNATPGYDFEAWTFAAGARNASAVVLRPRRAHFFPEAAGAEPRGGRSTALGASTRNPRASCRQKAVPPPSKSTSGRESGTSTVSD